MSTITWDELDRIETPGPATFEGRSFQLKQIHIDAWKEDPNGVWTLERFTTLPGEDWSLVSFHPSTEE